MDDLRMECIQPIKLGMGADGEDRGGLGVVLGILVLGTVLAGLSWYVVRLAISEGQPEAQSERADLMPAQTLEETLDAIARLLADDRWEAAERLCARAVEQYPADREVRLRYAEVLQGQGRFAEAYEQYVEALAIGPRDAKTEYLAALCANSAGMVEDAITHMEFARQRDSKNPRYALELGLIQFNAGLYDEARGNLTLARTLDPEQAIAWGMLAQIALKRGDHQIARTYIARARELAPDSLDWRVVEARAVVRDDPQRAIELLEGLPSEALMRVDVRSVLRSAYGSLGRFAEAAEIFARASDMEPSREDLALETADLYERAGNLDKAIEYARRASIVGGEAARRMLARLEGAG